MLSQRVVIYIKEIFRRRSMFNKWVVVYPCCPLYITIHTAWVVPICDMHQHKSRACMRHTTGWDSVFCVCGRYCARISTMAAYIPPFPALFVSRPANSGYTTHSHKELPLQASLLVASRITKNWGRFSSLRKKYWRDRLNSNMEKCVSIYLFQSSIKYGIVEDFI